MDTCIFCKIVKGEIPSARIYEDDFTIALIDINPSSRGHSIVIPKNHAGNIFEISAEDWGHVQETVRRVATAAENALSADGVNIIMNNRESAGQTVHHAHVHIIPRYTNDGLRPWPHSKLTEDASALAGTIASAL